MLLKDLPYNLGLVQHDNTCSHDFLQYELYCFCRQIMEGPNAFFSSWPYNLLHSLVQLWVKPLLREAEMDNKESSGEEDSSRDKG